MKRTSKKLVRETFGSEPYEYYPVGRHIVIAPGVCGGRPTFKYTRIDIRHALRLVAGGRPIEQVARGYQIPVAAMQEALAMAAKAFDQTAQTLVRSTPVLMSSMVVSMRL